MKKFMLFLVGTVMFSMGAISAGSDEAQDVKVSVLKNNVNLRARPTLTAETVGQVSRNDELRVKRFMDEWVEVVPPVSVDLWVLGDYVKDGVIDGDNVNVRAGAGINFSIVGQLARGDNVVVRGTLGQWVGIAPPETCSLWIHSSLVEKISVPPEEEPEPEPMELRDEITDTDIETPSVKPDPEALAMAPPDLDLLPAMEQGRIRQYEGILRPRSFLVRSPSRFRLVGQDEHQRTITICFVKGNEAQLNALVNRRMVIKGREYWVRRSDQPVLVPERIMLKSAQ